MDMYSENKLFEEKETSFYITLPSKASRTQNPSKYTIDLDKPLELNGNWSTGVSSFFIRHSWKKQGTFIRIWHSESQNFDINTPINETIHATSNRMYIDISIQSLDFEKKQFLDDLNTIIANRMTNVIDDKGLHNIEHTHSDTGIFDRIVFNDSLDFKWDSRKKRYAMRNAYFKIQLPYVLCCALGFDDNTFSATQNNYLPAKCTPNYMSDTEYLYIYSDIINSSIIGQSHAQIFEIEPIETSYGDLISHKYNTVHYYGINCSKVHSISIEFTNSQGINLPCRFGETVVVLHFLKKSI